jgi:hypothetical protein
VVVHRLEPEPQIVLARRPAAVVDELARLEHRLPVANHSHGITGCHRRIDVLLQVAHRDHLVTVGCQVVHISLEFFLGRADPVVGRVGHAVELEHRHSSAARLLDRGDEIRRLPVGPRIAGTRNEQRMVEPRLKGEAAAWLVFVLGSPSAAGKTNPFLVQDLESLHRRRIARPGEAGRGRNPVLAAAIVDRPQLFGNLSNVFLVDAKMVARMIADLEAVLVELGDFVPGHVTRLLSLKSKPSVMKNVAPNWYLSRMGRTMVNCDLAPSSNVSTTSLSGSGSRATPVSDSHDQRGRRAASRNPAAIHGSSPKRGRADKAQSLRAPTGMPNFSENSLRRQKRQSVAHDTFGHWRALAALSLAAEKPDTQPGR